MPQRRQLARATATIDHVRGELFKKRKQIGTRGIQQRTLSFFQELGELPQIAAIGIDGERREPFLNCQIGEKREKDIGSGHQEYCRSQINVPA